MEVYCSLWLADWRVHFVCLRCFFPVLELRQLTDPCSYVDVPSRAQAFNRLVCSPSRIWESSVGDVQFDHSGGVCGPGF